MADLIRLRRDTAATWTSVNPVLAAGEPGVETDTGKLKLGNGSTAWTSLPYVGTTTAYTDEQARDAIAAALVAGTGMTITVDDPGDHITLAAAGGGGGGGTVKDRRWTVGPAETSIDEFNDASLDPAWTRVDTTAGSVTWTEAADVLSVKHTIASDGAGVLHGLVRPLSGIGGSIATGDGFVTCLAAHPAVQSFTIPGIVVSDGVTVGAGKQISGAVYCDAARTQYSSWVSPFTNWNTQGSPATTNNSGVSGSWMWLRLVYLGSTNWRHDSSIDGVSWWTNNSTLSLSSFTPTHVGFHFSNWNTSTPGVAGFECFRRVSGIT